MREMICLLKAGIRSGKSEFFSILLLTFFTSLLLTVVITMNGNTKKRDLEAMEEAGFYTLLAGFAESELAIAEVDIAELAADIQKVESVETVKRGEALSLSLELEDGADSRALITSYEASGLNYTVQSGTDMKKLKDVTIQDGEIYVPFCLQALYSYEMGDTIQIKGTDETFRISGFFEDPVMGSSLMGIKTMLVSQNDLKRLRSAYDPMKQDETKLQNEEEKTSILPMTLLLIEKSPDCSWTDMQFEQHINQETDFENYAQLTISMSQANGYMMIITKIFAGILTVFVGLLVIVVLIVIGHGLNSALEMEYINIGILKAMGFTGTKLKTGMALQYLLAAAIGMLCGIPSAIPLIHGMNLLMRPVTGLWVSGGLAMKACLPAEFAVFFVIILFLFGKLKKMVKITPIHAIAEGREDIYFRNRFQTEIRKRGLNVWLALRQLTSHGKQYIGAGLITMILVFFLSIVSALNGWIGEDGESLLQLFVPTDADLEIVYKDEKVRQEVETDIKKRTEIESSFSFWMGNVAIEGSRMQCNVCDAPEEFVTVYEGRTCKYDNEILITEFAAGELGVSIGDMVELTKEEGNAEYIISGYYECGNDMGSNFSISWEGYRRLTGEDPKDWSIQYCLGGDCDVEALRAELEKRYGEKIEVASNRNFFDGIDIIVGAIHAITYVIYVIAAVFVVITISMVCGKIFRREKKDYGIYKALGFHSTALRRQFAFCFAGTAFLGSIGGILLKFLLSDRFAGLLFSMMGCRGTGGETEGIASIVIPCVFVILLSGCVAYQKAGCIRNVDEAILIAEA